MFKYLLCASLSLLFFSQTYAEEAKKDSLGGYDKGFHIGSADKKYDLRLNGRLQGRARYEYDNKKHEVGLSIPNARVSLKGHVFDDRFGYGIQLGFDRGEFMLQDFFANFGIFPDHMQMKVGRFLGGYSWLEGVMAAHQEFVDRSIVYNSFKLGTLTGLSFHNGRMGNINWDAGIYEGGISRVSGKRLGIASGSISYNHNQIDATSETDFDGGALRFITTLGAFAKTQIDDWDFVGYGTSLGGLVKLNHTSLNAGLYFGVPEAPRGFDQNNGKITQDISKDDVQIGALVQGGHLFQKRYGVGARYGLITGAEKITTTHEVLGSLSLYVFNHDLKVQLDGGTIIRKKAVTPQVQAQVQLAF